MRTFSTLKQNTNTHLFSGYRVLQKSLEEHMKKTRFPQTIIYKVLEISKDKENI